MKVNFKIVGTVIAALGALIAGTQPKKKVEEPTIEPIENGNTEPTTETASKETENKEAE